MRIWEHLKEVSRRLVLLCAPNSSKWNLSANLLWGKPVGCDPGDPAPTQSCPQRVLRVGRGSGWDKPCASQSQVAYSSSGITANRSKLKQTSGYLR